MPANQAYFSLPNILSELPALNKDKNNIDDEGEQCFGWFYTYMHKLVPENFMNGLTGAQDKVVMDVHLNRTIRAR